MDSIPQGDNKDACVPKIYVKTFKDLPDGKDYPIRFGTIALVEDSDTRYSWHNTWIKIVPLENRIVAAAAKFPDGQIIVSVRHYDELFHNACRQMNLREVPHSEIIQGFVDRFGTFHDRKAAWTIAEVAQQIQRRVGGDHEGILYSENLY